MSTEEIEPVQTAEEIEAARVEEFHRPYTDYTPEILNELTDKEIAIVRDYGNYEYMDGHVTDYTQNWGFAFAEDAGNTINATNRRTVSGVISSLTKKGFVQSDGTGPEDGIGFSGKMIAANLFLNHENDFDKIKSEYDPAKHYFWITQNVARQNWWEDDFDNAVALVKKYGGKLELVSKEFIDNL